MQSWYRYVLVSVLAGSLLLAGPLRWTEAGNPRRRSRGPSMRWWPSWRIIPSRLRSAAPRFGTPCPALCFEEMAQRTLAQHWRPLTPPQRQEFVEPLRISLEGSYVNRMLNANPKSQSVRYVKETIDQDQAAVHTEIGNPRDARYSGIPPAAQGGGLESV